MATHEAIQEIEYEALPGGSLAANLAAGAFAGIMVGLGAENGFYSPITLREILIMIALEE